MHANIIPQLTLQHFLDMEQLELQYYDAEFITPAEEAWQWYRIYPNTTVAAEVNGRLAGFVNLFPVQKAVYKALQEGRYNDHYMKQEDVASPADSPLHMFLSCVLVDENFRGRGILRQLLQAAVQQYGEADCVGVITDNVTADGCRFSERFGFTRRCRSDHQSWVYEHSWQEFRKSVNEAGSGHTH